MRVSKSVSVMLVFVMLCINILMLVQLPMSIDERNAEIEGRISERMREFYDDGVISIDPAAADGTLLKAYEDRPDDDHADVFAEFVGHSVAVRCGWIGPSRPYLQIQSLLLIFAGLFMVLAGTGRRAPAGDAGG